MRTVEIDERDFDTPDEALDYLARELDFPGYFGRNLRALNDCLGDVGKPTKIRARRRRAGAGTWFERLTVTLMRAACENDNLSVTVRAS